MADADPNMAAGYSAPEFWGDLYPELGYGPIPVDYLHEQKFYDLERDKIFKKCWVYAGRVEEIPSPFGFLVKEIEICKASVIITRDDATGKLSAYHNLCKHRLNKLVYEQSGSAGSFVCQYHAWAYDRSGKLRHVPDEAAFRGLDKEKCALSRVAVDEWRGFIFINLDPNPSETLLEYLEDIPEMTKDYPFEHLAAAHIGLSTEIDVNWKVAQHTNMETYHGIKLHSSHLLNGEQMIDPTNPNNRPLDIKLMKRHRMMAFGIRQDMGIESMPPTMRRAFGFIFMGAEGAPKGGFPGTNFRNHPSWAGDVFFVFPNLCIATAAGFFQTLINEPLGRRRNRFTNNFYYPKPENFGQMFATRVAVVSQYHVVCNDMWAGARIQEGLETGAATEMQLNDSEIGIRHEYKVYQDMVAA